MIHVGGDGVFGLLGRQGESERGKCHVPSIGSFSSSMSAWLVFGARLVLPWWVRMAGAGLGGWCLARMVWVMGELSPAGVVALVNASFPGAARVTGGGRLAVSGDVARPGVFVSVGIDSGLEVAGLLTGAGVSVRALQWEEAEFAGGSWLGLLRVAVSMRVGFRGVASAMLGFEQVCGQELWPLFVVDDLVPADVDALVPWDAATVSPGEHDARWAVMSFAERMLSELPFCAQVPLDAAGEVLAVLLCDAAAVLGFDLERRFDHERAMAVLASVAGSGDLVAAARRLVAPEPGVVDSAAVDSVVVDSVVVDSAALAGGVPGGSGSGVPGSRPGGGAAPVVSRGRRVAGVPTGLGPGAARS
jgi:hypothetical protein